jgi:EAL domain-containing protein (putative c-di-GMP-specific phosphodiesterase class I)
MSRVVALARSGLVQNRAPDVPAIITEHRFDSVYQPILSPTHQKLVGYEALMRASRNGQALSPADIFTKATELGQSAELDRFLLHLHLDNFQAGSQPAWLFVNINPDTCIHPEASLERLAHHCRQSGLHPERLVLELVETAADDPQALLAFVELAKTFGFQIAIDDFGMGDSNFERLWRMNPLIVKLDRSLLVNAECHTRARLLLESLVRMIRESGSLVLLEGVETETQARIALDTEADLLQGFLFARPGTIDTGTVTRAEQALYRTIECSSACGLRDVQHHEGFLRLLRLEMMDACYQLARGLSFDQACTSLLQMDGVKRCFVLNQAGVQQGNLARATPDIRRGSFNPLYHSAGACWSHREYFRNAQARPQHISVSRPYVALPDAKRTVTLSTSICTELGQQVVCVDLHPDELFDGQLTFPATL